MNAPLFAKHHDWRSRWLLVGAHGEVLHRIESLQPEGEWREDVTSAEGRAICGRTGWFFIPGIFSRMGAKRCERCCDLLGIPHGDGAPFNSDIAEPGCEGPEPYEERRADEEMAAFVAAAVDGEDPA